MSGHFWTRKCFFDVLSMLFRCCFKRFGVRISIDFASLRVAGRSFDVISMDFNVVSWFRAETHVLTTNEPLHSSPLWIHSRLGAVQFQTITSTLSPNSLSDPRRTALEARWVTGGLRMPGCWQCVCWGVHLGDGKVGVGCGCLGVLDSPRPLLVGANDGSRGRAGVQHIGS